MRVLDSTILVDILTSGNLPDNFVSHMMHLLDETPVQIVILAAEQAARQTGIPLRQIWTNLWRFSSDLGAHRRHVWNPLSVLATKGK